MKVALATWNGRISPVFDVARQVLLVDIEKGKEVSRREEALPGTNPWAQAERLATLGVDVLICGAISQTMAAILASKGIGVMPFIAGAVEEVLAGWLTGMVPNSAMIMPGCCGRRMRWCHGVVGPGRGGRGWANRGDPAGGVMPPGRW